PLRHRARPAPHREPRISYRESAIPNRKPGITNCGIAATHSQSPITNGQLAAAIQGCFLSPHSESPVSNGEIAFHDRGQISANGEPAITNQKLLVLFQCDLV